MHESLMVQNLWAIYFLSKSRNFDLKNRDREKTELSRLQNAVPPTMDFMMWLDEVSCWMALQKRNILKPQPPSCLPLPFVLATVISFPPQSISMVQREWRQALPGWARGPAWAGLAGLLVPGTGMPRAGEGGTELMTQLQLQPEERRGKQVPVA